MPSLHEYQRRLTRNTAFLTAAFTAQKVLSSLYIFVYGNLVGTAASGSYLFAISFANVFGILMDIGLSPILIREVARRPDRARALLHATVRTKIVTSVIALAILGLSAVFAVHGSLRRSLLVFTALVMVFESFNLTLYGVLRGLQKLRYEAIGSTLHQVIVLGAGSVLLLLTKNPIWLGAVLLLASVANAVYAVLSLRRELKLLPSSEVESRFPWSVRLIAPFFFSGVFTKIYAYIDVVLVGLLTSDHFVGLYGFAYKLTYAFQFIPVAFNSSLYPALSQAHHDSPETLPTLAERSLRFLLLLSVPIAVLIGVHARPIFTLLLPKFADATLALQISVTSLPFLFINFLFSSLLNATNLQVKNTLALSGAVVSSVVLNLLLIPEWKQVGASIASLSSTIVLFLTMGFFCRRTLRIRSETYGFLLRLGVAAAATLGAGIFLSTRLQLFLSGAASASVFLLAAFALRLLTPSLLRSLITPLRRQSV